MATLKIATFGAGFVGIPTSSVLAFHNPQHKVILGLVSLLSTTSFLPGSSSVSRTNPPSLNLDSKNSWSKSME
jgi:hypothetical protein